MIPRLNHGKTVNHLGLKFDYCYLTGQRPTTRSTLRIFEAKRSLTQLFLKFRAAAMLSEKDLEKCAKVCLPTYRSVAGLDQSHRACLDQASGLFHL